MLEVSSPSGGYFVLLQTSGSQVVGRDPLEGVSFRSHCMSDIYIVVHKSSKITVVQQQK